jgi:hypothetical protein
VRPKRKSIQSQIDDSRKKVYVGVDSVKYKILFVVFAVFSLLSVCFTSTAQNPVIPPHTYQILKVNLHAHTTYSDGTFTPAQLVNIYKDAGYDVLAITDHSTVAGYGEAYTEGTNIGLTVIRGEEVTCSWSDGSPKHVVALFINQTLGISGNSNVEIPVIFDAIHSQSGIGIVAHAWSSWSNWQNCTNEPWIDGWEVDYSMAWVLESGSIYLLNHDFHNETWLQGIRSYWTYLLAENRTEAGVRDALMERRIVIYGNGTLFGSSHALRLYTQNQDDLKIPTPTPTIPPSTVSPSQTTTPSSTQTPTRTHAPTSIAFPTSNNMTATSTTAPTSNILPPEATYAIATVAVASIFVSITMVLLLRKRR